MKKCVFLFMFLMGGLTLSAQKTIADVFATGEVVWYGLDFTNTKFVGVYGSGAGTAEDIKKNLMPSWNNLIISEPGKYDLGTTFKKHPVINDLREVTKANQNIDESGIIDFNNYRFAKPEEVIANAVAGYGTGAQESGLGLVFIVECFDKNAVDASLYVTFFDIATKKVLMTERVTGKPAGFGLRNYWGGGIYGILKQIQKQEYKSWSVKYK
ncbi:MAG: hypothetical protein QM786_11710 [Breznakibacter sp.]